MDQNIEKQKLLRLINNFYNQNNLYADKQRFSTDVRLFEYVSENKEKALETKRVALVFICLNPLYWRYASDMVFGAKEHFLPGHKTDFFFWTDIPETREEITEALQKNYYDAITSRGGQIPDPSILTKGKVQAGNFLFDIPQEIEDTFTLRSTPGIHIIPTEPMRWPFPTLLRYSLFLQQEEKLKEYDYIFYLDVDMKFEGTVGDEVLGDGLTAAPHPGYAIRKEYIPPYEPNPESTSFIPRPGRVVLENGQPRFAPFYAAGGFQGGKSEIFIEAMREMSKMIDDDYMRNYIPIWNDETVWNKYLFDHPPSVYLTPSYVYPDSLIKEYYEPLWGCAYPPKIKTLTKWFTLSQGGGQHLHKMLNETKNLQ